MCWYAGRKLHEKWDTVKCTGAWLLPSCPGPTRLLRCLPQESCLQRLDILVRHCTVPCTPLCGKALQKRRLTVAFSHSLRELLWDVRLMEPQPAVLFPNTSDIFPCLCCNAWQAQVGTSNSRCCSTVSERKDDVDFPLTRPRGAPAYHFCASG